MGTCERHYERMDGSTLHPHVLLLVVCSASLFGYFTAREESLRGWWKKDALEWKTLPMDKAALGLLLVFAVENLHLLYLVRTGGGVRVAAWESKVASIEYAVRMNTARHCYRKEVQAATAAAYGERRRALYVEHISKLLLRGVPVALAGAFFLRTQFHRRLGTYDEEPFATKTLLVLQYWDLTLFVMFTWWEPKRDEEASALSDDLVVVATYLLVLLHNTSIIQFHPNGCHPNGCHPLGGARFCHAFVFATLSCFFALTHACHAYQKSSESLDVRQVRDEVAIQARVLEFHVPRVGVP